MTPSAAKRITFNRESPLTCHDIPRVDKKYLAAKFVISDQRYSELDEFRQEIEESKAGLHHQPYSNNKRNVMLYKSVFFGFALFFAFLSLGVLVVPSAISCGFFSFCTAIKSTLATASSFFSLCSFSIGFMMKPEREAIYHYVRKARKTVATIYARKKIRMGIKRFFVLFTSHRHQAATLRQMFHETCDKINEKKEHALHLAHRISTAKTLTWEQKESLLNQAIEELNESLMKNAHNFRHTPLPTL